MAAILESNGLHWSELDDHFQLRFASASLQLGFTPIGTQTLLTMRAPVLRELPRDPDRSEEILLELNSRNCQSHFAKWALHQEHRAIVVEYDMLADHLQEDELMTALATLARLADQHDDVLQQRFGGSLGFQDSDPAP